MFKDYTSIIEEIRKDFPFFQTDQGKNTIYMDNAATSLTPKPVLDAMTEYYVEYPANIHRAVYNNSQTASDHFEKARETTARFLGVQKQEVIFTSGTTASINHFSRSFAEAFLQKGDKIVLSGMEHHANLLPWQRIAHEFECVLEFIPITLEGELDLSAIDQLLTPDVKLLSLTAVSNTLGTINPIDMLAAKCRQLGIYTFIDAAQSVSHIKYSLAQNNIDFLAFSGHKIFGPTGIGVLWGREELLKKMPPFFLGGGIVYDVSLENAVFSSIPSRFEAGTPPIAEAIGLATALDYLEKIGWETIQGIELQHMTLASQVFEQFQDYVRVFGTSNHKVPIFSFAINGVHPHDIGSLFNEMNIAVRTGHQCTQPVWKCFGVSSTTRASTSIYNLPTEWEQFSHTLQLLLEFFHVGKFS